MLAFSAQETPCFSMEPHHIFHACSFIYSNICTHKTHSPLSSSLYPIPSTRYTCSTWYINQFDITSCLRGHMPAKRNLEYGTRVNSVNSSLLQTWNGTRVVRHTHSHLLECRSSFPSPASHMSRLEAIWKWWTPQARHDQGEIHLCNCFFFFFSWDGGCECSTAWLWISVTHLKKLAVLSPLLLA